MKHLGRALSATLFLLFLTSALVWADNDNDPPGRVARLQYITGSVSIQPRGADDWVAGAVNRPLTTADNIWTEKDSRAELNLGGGYLRMNGETSVTLANVSDNSTQVQLHQGTLNLSINKLFKGEIYEVDTPNIAFIVQKSGDYRFDVGPDGEATVVTVWKGQGDATGDGPSVRVKAHQQAQFTNGTSLTNQISAAPNYDGFDDWCLVRDQRLDSSVSARYVTPGTIGYEDLDQYGSWRVVPTYGSVWVPAAVTPGWAPYRYGHWVWVSPWGWTWVDDAPWGFAPFHYGRWVYYGGYWGWAPGPYVRRAYYRPVYAPALVAWFGGPGWGVGFGFGGGYGWCPLGYGEPFFPWYGGSQRYFRNVNVTNTRITNITYITNNYYNGRPRTAWPVQYKNLSSPGGMTAVPQRTIVSSLPVSRAFVPVSSAHMKEFTSAPVGTKLGIEPSRESRLGVNDANTNGRPAAVPPQKAADRPVFSRVAPTPASNAARPGGSDSAALVKPDRAIGEMPRRQQPPSPATPGRFVPRPPATDGTGGGFTARNAPKLTGGDSQPGPQHPDATGGGTRMNVPRPPTPGSEVQSTPSAPSAPGHSVPRPPDGNRAPDQPSVQATPGVLHREAPESRPPAAPTNTAPAAPRVPTNNPNPPTNSHTTEPHAAPQMPPSTGRPTNSQPGSAPQSAPRPQPGPSHAPAGPGSAGTGSNGSGSTGFRSNGSTSFRYVPRPTGPVTPASYAYSYSPDGSYRAPSTSSYSSPRYDGLSAPASRSYAAPAYSAPANGSTHSYRGSSPSYRSAPRRGSSSGRSSRSAPRGSQSSHRA